MKRRYIMGVDEVGRGPLAGPVTVGIAVTPATFDWSKLPGVTDSKKLTESQRAVICAQAQTLKELQEIDYTVASVTAPVIDAIGIVPAVNRAMQQALRRLDIDPQLVHIKLDGGLKAPNEYVHQETIIRGDQKEQAIGLASIVAKVARDRYMTRKSHEETFAPYGFSAHKGYGTKQHREAICAHGLSSLHRKSFCKSFVLE